MALQKTSQQSFSSPSKCNTKITKKYFPGPVQTLYTVVLLNEMLAIKSAIKFLVH